MRQSRLCGCIAAFVVGLVLLTAVVVALRTPFSKEGGWSRWLTAYRREYVVSGLGTGLVVGGLVGLVSARRLRLLLLGLGAVGLVSAWVLPFGYPVVLRGRLAHLEGTLTGDGVCLQSNGYTCGPACVVTALERLGLRVEEGAVAVATHANPFSGTQEEDLCDYINQVGDSAHITAELVALPSVRDLDEAPVILPVKHSLLMNHYVVYLGREEGDFVIGDPLSGAQRWPPEHLQRRWFKMGIAVRKAPSAREPEQQREAKGDRGG